MFSGTAPVVGDYRAQAHQTGAGGLFEIDLQANERAAIVRVTALDALGNRLELTAIGHYVPEVGWTFASDLVSGLSLSVTAPLVITVSADFGNTEAIEAWLSIEFTQNYPLS